jgi:hypothetical protein
MKHLMLFLIYLLLLSSHGLELKKMDGLKPVMAILTLTNLELMKA